LLFGFELLLVNAAVKGGGPQQLLVPAAGDYATPVENKDLICPLNSGKPVGNNKSGAVLHHFFERQLNEMLGLAIHAGCGVIQDEDARIHQQGAGDGNTLLLPP